MKVEGISVRITQTGRGCRKAGLAQNGPQIERSPHWRREPPDLIHRHAHVCARALARGQQRICNKRFICVEDGVSRDSERACQSACRGKTCSRGQLLFENRLPHLIVNLAVQRACGLRLDLQGRHGRVRWALQNGTLCGESGSLPTTILDGQSQTTGKLGSGLI
jgi:hypothetical protein